MTWWEAILLGLIQGLTEFLPVSSSGHLVLVQHLLGLASDDVTFEVFVHFGTVLSIIHVYRRRLGELIRNGWAGVANPSKVAQNYRENADFRFVIFILITMIPTFIIYLIFKDSLKAAFGDPRQTLMMLLVTGVLLLLTKIRRNPDGPLTPLKSLLIGAAQGAALIPGISRSGATICTALYQNVTPERAANFSFLMSLPVIIGATAISAIKMFQTGVGPDLWIVLLATIVAYGSGIIAIKIVLDFVRRGNLEYFAYYCFAVGILGLILI